MNQANQLGALHDALHALTKEVARIVQAVGFERACELAHTDKPLSEWEHESR